MPGCGSGYEVQAFAERGHDVPGIDLSDLPLRAAAADERGPPFGIDRHRLAELRADNFELVEDEIVPAEQSVPVLAGHEVWQVWKRRL